MVKVVIGMVIYRIAVVAILIGMWYHGQVFSSFFSFWSPAAMPAAVALVTGLVSLYEEKVRHEPFTDPLVSIPKWLLNGTPRIGADTDGGQAGEHEMAALLPSGATPSA